jgi:Flp pilus assembly protein TadG
MTWTLSDSGTTAALNVASGETILATDTNNGTFVLEVDTSNIINGDLVEIRIYTITLSGGTLTQAWKGTYQHAQINNHKISPPIASDQSIKCTVKLLAVVSGTRTFDWKMLRI